MHLNRAPFLELAVSTLSRVALVLVLVVSAMPIAMAAPSGAAPSAVIERLHETLIETMKNPHHLDIEGRYKALSPVLEDSFDFERMIAAAAGSYWTSADDAERKRLFDAFTRLSEMTYAARFKEFSGESFQVMGERPGPRETVLVDTQLTRSDGPPVQITYVMTKRNDEWRIVDVLLDRSISELAVRRSEYNKILRSGGPEKLAQTLDEKTEQLRTE
jgi:phospholipid transport system substrate-binding protein